MIRSRPRCSASSRRALVRSSITVSTGESSIHIGAACMSFMTWAIFDQSVSSTKPVCSGRGLIPTPAERRRSASCSLLISSEKTPTFLASRTAACWAMFSARLVFPTLGRAARMIRSDGWKPPSSVSSWREAGRDAQDLAAMLVQVLEPVVGLAQQRRQRLEAAGGAVLADLEQDPLRPVDGDLGVVRLLVADRRDPPGGADQVAQHRLALDDAAVVLDVDRRRHRVHQAGQVGRARRPAPADRAAPARRPASRGRSARAGRAGRASPRRCRRAAGGRSRPDAGSRRPSGSRQGRSGSSRGRSARLRPPGVPACRCSSDASGPDAAR